MNLFLIYIVVILLPFLALAQPNIDSIKDEIFNEVNKAKGLQRAFILDEKIKKVAHININFTNQLLSNAIGYTYDLRPEDNEYQAKMLRAKMLSNISYNLIQQNQLTHSLDSAKKSLEIYSELKRPEFFGHPYSKLATAYSYISEYEKAIEIYEQGFQSFSNKSLDSLVDLYYSKENQVPDSIKLVVSVGLILRVDYGLLLNNLGQNEPAIEKFKEVLAISIKTNDYQRETAALANIGMIYSEMQEPKKAQVYLFQAEAKAKENMLYHYLSNIYAMISKTMENLERYPQAVHYLRNSISLKESIGFFQHSPATLLNMGILYKNINILDSAEYFLKSSFESADTSGQLLVKVQTLRALAELYETKKDFEKTTQILKQLIFANDSLDLFESSQKLQNYEKDLKLKDKENEVLKLQTEKEKAEKERFYIFGLAAVLLLLVFIFINRFRYKSRINDLLEEQKTILQEANQELSVLNETKDKFFSIIAHDLKNPLATMINITELVGDPKYDLSDQEKSEFLSEINNAAKNLLDLLQNLLTWANSQRGKIDFVPMQIDLSEIAMETVYLTKPTAELKNIDLKSNLDFDITAYCDLQMTRTIIRNLVSNALKFTPEGGKININQRYKGELLEIEVEDSGIGMSDDVKNKLFRIDVNVTTRGTNQEQGTGLGLILCKEFVEKQGGKIWVESEQGKGSKFIFTLPKVPIQS